jgi:hypothetical protein
MAARNFHYFQGLVTSPFLSNGFRVILTFVPLHLTPKGASTMEWVTPRHEEIDLNCEVSSYANAEL